MTYEQEQIKQYTALGVITALIIFLSIALSRFITVLFGALIIVTLFWPLYKFFTTKKLSASVSAILVCLISTIIIAIPLILFSGLLISEASHVIQNTENIGGQIAALDTALPQFHIVEQLNGALVNIASSFQKIIINALSQITATLINLVVMYFLIYFMLAHNHQALRNVKKYIPFNRKNTAHLVEAFKRITKTTILGAGLVALIQGLILGIGLSIVGIPNPVLLGFVGAIISFLPVVGVALIWIPIAIMQFIAGSYWGVVGLLITGGAISLLDYTLRPHFQKKQGDIHPLVSLLGVLIGIQYFGLFGIVVGPLLLSYAVLTINMFVEEYVKTSN